MLQFCASCQWSQLNLIAIMLLLVQQFGKVVLTRLVGRSGPVVGSLIAAKPYRGQGVSASQTPDSGTDHW